MYILTTFADSLNVLKSICSIQTRKISPIWITQTAKLARLKKGKFSNRKEIRTCLYERQSTEDKNQKLIFDKIKIRELVFGM